MGQKMIEGLSNSELNEFVVANNILKERFKMRLISLSVLLNKINDPFLKNLSIIKTEVDDLKKEIELLSTLADSLALQDELLAIIIASSN